MKLVALEVLHKSMLALTTEARPVDLQAYRVTISGVIFDVLFSTREQPYSLALTCAGKMPVLFIFPVAADYQVPPMFSHGMYARLCSVLRTTGGAGNKLVPKAFLASLEGQTPTVASLDRLPSPPEHLLLRPDVVEERNKPYFSHWRSPGSRKDGTVAKVSEDNQRKTLVLLGSKALAYSLANNRSSSWTAAPSKAA